MFRRTIPAILAGTLALAALAACGSSDDGSTGAAGGRTTQVTRDEEPKGPQRIVSLSPTATEMLFALDAGDRVVAVDEMSNYPADAPVTDLSGFEPNVEAIADYEPDLVVMESDQIQGELDELGIDLFVATAPATIDGVYEQIQGLGAVIDHADAAAQLTREMREDIEAVTAEVDPDAEPLTYYHELDDTFYSVTSQSFVGAVYALAGLDNIADAADTTGSGYPQLSAEYILAQDPDLIFLADGKCCGQTPETVASRPGWDALRAVRDGNVVVLDDDVASRWGPRIVDLLREIVGAATEARAG